MMQRADDEAISARAKNERMLLAYTGGCMNIFHFGLLGSAIFLPLYFIPAAVAFSWSHHNRVAILLLNIFLGWTIVGWVGALVWAATDPSPSNAPSAAQPLSQGKDSG